MATTTISERRIHPMPVALALAMAAVLAGSTSSALVSRFHLATETALMICATLSSGGIYAVLAIWPFLAPAIATVEFTLAIFGVSSTVAF
jgi:hypothetical protein